MGKAVNDRICRAPKFNLKTNSVKINLMYPNSKKQNVHPSEK